ncbi:hypothetical protein M404DRAFT_1009346 [Pisolithus tinctorius Marx 270]|uniref:Uncharacterized protein n=1 Tax=Pisolithus tinctorius Marx 270 TaxID=870435 RepID=A0A0C3J590_PISTI|nr:hypothetical protein M404DRAFT_1009346 [Pisolithus tinctorius Marx 270]
MHLYVRPSEMTMYLSAVVNFTGHRWITSSPHWFNPWCTFTRALQASFTLHRLLHIKTSCRDDSASLFYN